MSTPDNPTEPGSRKPLSQDVSPTQRKIEFDSASRELAGPIVDWCKSLSCSKVKEIRLHRRFKPPATLFFVVVVLGDESAYSIQRLKPDLHGVHNAAASLDAIERLPFKDSASQQLITVGFSPQHCPDFLLILSVCQGIQGISSGLRRMVFANDEFFAYALLSNVTRHSLCPQDMPNEAETEVEALWRDIYLFVHNREYGFRERTIAGQTHTIVQSLLRTATKEKATRLLQSTSISGQSEAANQILAKVASATAWAEVSASSHNTLQHSRWDRAWNHRWNTAWNNRWSEQWMKVTKQRSSSMGLKTLGNLGITLTRPNPEGGASGRMAGRAPVQVQARIIAGTSLNPDFSSFPGADWPLNKPKNVPKLSNTNVPQIEITAPEIYASGTQRPSPAHRLPSLKKFGLVPYPENCTVWTTMFELAAEIGWAAAWRHSVAVGKQTAESLIHSEKPDNSQAEPSLKSASKRPSVLQRTLSSKLVRQLSGQIPKLTRTGSRLSGSLSRNESKPESIEKLALPASPVSEGHKPHSQLPETHPTPSNGHHQAASHDRTNKQSYRGAARIREVYFSESTSSYHRTSREAKAAVSRQRREEDEARRKALDLAKKVMGASQRPDDEDMTRRANEAWEYYAAHMANSPEQNLPQIAEKEWLGATNRSGTIIPPIMGEDQKQEVMRAWKETFRQTWQAAWMDAWKAAWCSTWEYGWKEAMAKGIESGVDEVLKSHATEEYKSLLRLNSYQQAKKLVHAETTYLSSLSRMHEIKTGFTCGVMEIT
ncbi:hypothetical protein FRC12_017335 [Ceratobasidium sp. 428]|nr:hypothetical protein FRC12_017335 [Ceratobasidium sp. 428]